MKEIRSHGLCERDEIHDSHVFDVGPCLQECPGQYVRCRNCDDRKCMDCVLRYWHEACEESCPFCCGGTK